MKRYAWAVALLLSLPAVGTAISPTLPTTADEPPGGPGLDCTPHPPIRIAEDEGPEGFILDRGPAGEPIHRPGSGVVAGNGTPKDPYLIEGWCVPTPASPDLGPGIEIEGTEAHVLVASNVVRSLPHDAGGTGIVLVEATNVTVRDNVVRDHRWTGIQVVRSGPSVTVAGNEVAGNGLEGIVARNSEAVTIAHNGVSGHALSEIWLVGGRSLAVHDNSVADDAWTGIAVSAARDARIAHNNVTGNRQGVSIVGNGFFTSENVTLAANEISGNAVGIVVDGDHTDTVIEANNIHGNDPGPGLNASEAGIVVDATDNWWGCPDGPDDPACDEVRGNAAYDPWLEAPNPAAGA